MNTENVVETSSVIPVIVADSVEPSPVIPNGEGINVGEIDEKNDRRYSPRKVVNVDGTISYGLKADGTPRRRPGRKAKSVS